MVAAHMDAAEAIPHHARRAEQHLAERSVLPLGDGLDVLARETGPGGPEVRQDRGMILVKTAGHNRDLKHGPRGDPLGIAV